MAAEYVSRDELVRSVERLDATIHAQGCKLDAQCRQLDARIDGLGIELRAEISAVSSRMAAGFDVIDMRFKMVDSRFVSLEKQFQSGKRMMGLVAALMATWFTAMSLGIAWLQLDPTGSMARFRQHQQPRAPWSTAMPKPLGAPGG